MHSLNLQATEKNWRLFMLRKEDAGFLRFQTAVFERDAYTCQFCEFSAHQHFEVVNLDSNFTHNRLSNLTTACAFCWPCFFLEANDQLPYGAGTLIFCSELSQVELNALCHALFFSIANGDAHATESRNIYRALKLKAKLVDKALSEGMSKPAMYGRLLIEAGEKKSLVLQKKISPYLRLLPGLSAYAPQIKGWSTEALSTFYD